jgi:serine/threonine protein kinase
MALDNAGTPENLPDLGPYRAIKSLGAGGMGQVYLAETGDAGQKVAVKVLHKELIEQPNAVVRFTQLGAMAMKLHHPNVVKVLDCGTLDGGQPYWVMEYLEGHDLGELLSQKGTIDYQRMLEIARPVCNALHTAHQAGLVHLDIKPSNIFIAQEAGKEVIKLIDFGIAALKDQPNGESILGAPEYWSPEQASAREVDGRSDLYSLGVVLYESLTGNLPFRSHTFSDLVEHHLYSEPPPMSQVSMAPTNIPRPVKNVVLKCLAKDRTRRYQDALELERALVEAVQKAEEEENEPAMQIIGETPSGELMVQPAAPAEAQRPRSMAAKVGRAAISFIGGFVVIVALSSLFRQTPAAIAFAFAPSTVPVMISSDPPGALVYLEGARTPQGKTPLVVHFPRSQEATPVVVHFSEDAEMRTLVTPSHPSEVFVKMRGTSAKSE